MTASLALRTTNRSAVADEIRRLAKESGITYEATALDAWADHVTRLAGDDIELDGIENLLVELERAGVVTGPQATRLHAAYLASE